MASEQENHRRDDEKEENRKEKFVVPGDPPIIVGGGGSTVVWIRKNVFDKKLTDAERDTLAATPGVQPPANPNLYDVYRCTFDARAAVVRPDANIRAVRHSHMDRSSHRTDFHEAPDPN